jgi:glycosyltransferase involved in cell wall biosynthesis
MAQWSPVPFLIGPLNGGLAWPPGFRKELVREREWLSLVRHAHRILPYRNGTYGRASGILAAFAHTIRDLPDSAYAKTINFPEVGIDPNLFKEGSPRGQRQQKTILFVGRFVPYKLPQVVVRAFANRASLRGHRVVMVGDGPERPAIEKLIRDNGLEDQIKLTGWKTQEEVAAYMREADIFAFPSIRELGAGVVLEAMACGLACVVVDYGGPSDLIGADRGVKVPLGSMDQIVDGFGAALESLVADPQTTSALGRAAREHALRYYTWDAKARKTMAVYKWILGRGPRPDFWDAAPGPR